MLKVGKIKWLRIYELMTSEDIALEKFTFNGLFHQKYIISLIPKDENTSRVPCQLHTLSNLKCPSHQLTLHKEMA